MFKCDQVNCTQILCRRCVASWGASGQRYCQLCTINIQNKDKDWNIREDSGKVTSKFEHTVSVQINKETGTVDGWETLFKLIANEDVLKGNKIEEVKKLQKDFESKKAKSKASYVVERIEGSKYYIKSLEGKVYEVSLVTIGEGKAELQGLPNKLGTYLVNYTE